MSFVKFHLYLIRRKIELKHKSKVHHIVIIKCICTTCMRVQETISLINQSLSLGKNQYILEHPFNRLLLHSFEKMQLII